VTPDALAQICSRVGLSDAAELMALAPARQLVRALDASVWKTPRPGLPEVFDPRELLEWLPVWLEIGDEFTAERLGGDDPGGARCPVATSPERLLHLFSQLSGDESMLAPPSRQGIAGQAERPPSRQGIAGQAERPQWIQSLADLRGIGGLLRKLRKRRSPPRV